MLGRKAVFLDRDGVVNPLVFNQKTCVYESPKSVEEFRMFPYVPEALRKLKASGYLTFIVSNQPDAAKGKAKMEDLQKIEQSFAEFCLQHGGLIDKFYYCHHHPNGVVPEYTQICRCRKPGTLFLEQARDNFQVCLSESYLIGDRESDILCGINAGCKTIRIIPEHGQENSEYSRADTCVSNLLEAVDWIVQDERSGKMTISDYIANYLRETEQIARTIDQSELAGAVEILRRLRDRRGRLFILGVGGSAANASHAVNDFRKIGGIEAYAPTDNVSELTARTNDEGWNTTFSAWLDISKLNDRDVLLILSVGGGSDHTSMNIKQAVDLARERNTAIIGIVSRDGGYTKQYADACVLIPVIDKERITPHAEGWQGILWHLMVNAIKSAQSA